MFERSQKRLSGAVKSTVIATALAMMTVAAQAQGAGPFTGMNGVWAGNGSIAMQDGNKERIRCRATYQVDSAGNDARMEIRCASDSYRFELQGNAVFQNGVVVGNWSESTRNVGGNLTGSASPGKMSVRADGSTFVALLNLSTTGDRQSISIRSPGSALSEAVITLSRSK